jgi:hypothetical protein
MLVSSIESRYHLDIENTDDIHYENYLLYFPDKAFREGGDIVTGLSSPASSYYYERTYVEPSEVSISLELRCCQCVQLFLKYVTSSPPVLISDKVVYVQVLSLCM